RSARPGGRFPRLNAVASLKRDEWRTQPWVFKWFSTAKCRGLIEAEDRCDLIDQLFRCFPRLNAVASLKPAGCRYRDSRRACFPRLNAVASLKQVLDGHRRIRAGEFSTAKCRGLIEAWPPAPLPFGGYRVFHG